jgi:hypothetical protein
VLPPKRRRTRKAKYKKSSLTTVAPQRQPPSWKCPPSSTRLLQILLRSTTRWKLWLFRWKCFQLHDGCTTAAAAVVEVSAEFYSAITNPALIGYSFLGLFNGCIFVILESFQLNKSALVQAFYSPKELFSRLPTVYLIGNMRRFG